MKSTSSRKGVGSRSRSWRGVSVVPRIVLPSQGTAKSTRPSLVFGTISACVPGRKARSTTRCTPWLGATMAGLGGASVSRSMSRTASTQTPAALTTQRARRSKRSPLSASRACSPRTLPPSRSRSVTAQWFSTTAPRVMAVRANSTASRASSNCPSQYLMPPTSPWRRTVGSSSCVRRADSISVGPRLCRPASTSYIFSPVP